MNKISTSVASVLLLMSLPFTSIVMAQESAMEAAEEKCVIKAEDQNIPDDKFDDFVQKCIEEMMSGK